MSELKKYTRLGSDSRQLAALLQAKAPKGHMLAYINPQEAALLKSRGGSGEEHADTGIPSFELDDSFALQGETGGLPEVTGAPSAPVSASEFAQQDPYYSSPVGLSGGFSSLPSSVGPSAGAQAAEAYPDFGTATGAGAAGTSQVSTPTFQPAPFKGTEAPEGGGGGLKDLEAALSKYPSLTKLGTAGITGLLGARQARQATEQGQAGKAEMQQIASPYQQAGKAAQEAAQRGELMPVGQQTMQAAQAQTAQDIQRRGGVGAQQATQQLANLRQQLLQQQYDYGLKLSGIGDQIALGAIKTGIQADQYANQLTSAYYGNIMRSIYGAAGQPQTAGAPNA